MKFRRLLKGFSLLFFILPTGCTDLFNKTPYQAAAVSPQLGFQAQCLSSAVGVIERFTNGTAQAAEVSSTWTCFGNAISLFEKKVRGSDRNGFGPREVADFVQDHFLKDTVLTDDLLVEVMHIKQIFVGGAPDIITRSELLALVDFSQNMNEICLRLLPYMKVYTFNWHPELGGNYNSEITYFEDANTNLQWGINRLTSLIKTNNQSYDLRYLKVLFAQANISAGSTWTWVNGFNKDFPVFEQLKSILTGGDADIIKTEEWARFGILMARGYIQYLRYHYFIEMTTAADPQFIYYTNSIYDLFGFLGDMVRSKPGGVLTKQELVGLLLEVNHVFPSLNFTEEFVTQFMKIKVVFFGGGEEHWTADDFVKAQSQVKTFNGVLKKVWAFAPFYAMSWKPAELSPADAQAYFNDAEGNFIDLVNLLGVNLEAGYDLGDLTAFANSIDNLVLNHGKPFEWAQNLAKLVPTLIVGKKILLGDNTSVVTIQQWPKLFQTATDTYMRALYFSYFVKPANLSHGLGLTYLDNWLPQIQNTLQNIINNQTPGPRGKADLFIPKARFVELAEALGEAGILPAAVQPTSIVKIFDALMGKILLDPKARLSGYVSKGFSQPNLDALVLYYNIWSAGQHFSVDFAAQNPDGISQPTVIKKLQQSTSVLGASEFATVFAGAPPLIFNDKGQLGISYRDRLYNETSLTWANLSRVLARVFITSYIQDLSRLNSGVGLNLAETNLAYGDFFPLAVDLKLVGPADAGFMNSRFFEANIFTPAGDGNKFLSLGETTQLIEMIFSGLKLTNIMQGFIQNNCNVHPSDQSSSQDELYVECVYDIYNHHLEDVLAQQPDMLKYMQSISQSRRETLLSSYLQTAGWKTPTTGIATRSVVGLIPFVFQYAEIVQQHYDQNHDGILDVKEIDSAFPVYGTLIQQFSNTSNTLLNKAAFYYIVKNAKIPCQPTDVLEIAAGLVIGIRPTIKADRGHMADVLGAIAKKVNGVPDPSCKKPIEENSE